VELLTLDLLTVAVLADDVVRTPEKPKWKTAQTQAYVCQWVFLTLPFFYFARGLKEERRNKALNNQTVARAAQSKHSNVGSGNGYKWIALSNTALGTLMASINKLCGAWKRLG
jgi:hypothetical protein